MNIKKPLEGACKRYEEDLVLQYYGELSGSDRVRVESHLADCDRCREFLADCERLLPQMSRIEELPQSFWDGYYRQTMAKLDEHDEKRNRWRSWFLPSRSWMMPAFGTVTAAVLVVGLMFGKDNLRLFVEPRAERIPQEIMADRNQLEFFKSMDMLEALDKLEAQEDPKSENPRTDLEQAGGAGLIA